MDLIQELQKWMPIQLILFKAMEDVTHYLTGMPKGRQGKVTHVKRMRTVQHQHQSSAASLSNNGYSDKGLFGISHSNRTAIIFTIIGSKVIELLVRISENWIKIVIKTG